MLDGDKKCEDGRGERPLQAALTVSTAFLAHLQLGDIKVWGWDGMDGMGWDGMGWMGWDGSGFWLASKRVERATFAWPRDEAQGKR